MKTMQPCAHLGAASLIAWLLLMPPFSVNPAGKTFVDTHASLSRWEVLAMPATPNAASTAMPCAPSWKRPPKRKLMRAKAPPKPRKKPLARRPTNARKSSRLSSSAPPRRAASRATMPAWLLRSPAPPGDPQMSACASSAMLQTLVGINRAPGRYLLTVDAAAD